MSSPPPPPGRAPQVGSTIGHYRVDGVIGVGGMGMVYAATDLRLRRLVALKVVLGHFAESTQFLRRFQREATVLAKLDSPHVISIYDHGEHEGWPYIVTQYAAGGDLGRQIRERGALPPALAARVCGQVADALVAAHAVGVVHRDVKPANVLLRDERLDRMHVYLCDFGVAHTEATELTTPGAVAGTWNYLAPERAAGEHGTPASDLYSVGCLLWETLTGQPPYAGTDVEVAMAHLQGPVPQLPGHDDFTVRANQVLTRTLAKNPTQRFASAAELREELRSLGGGLTSSTTGAPLLLGPTRSRRRRVTVAAAGLAALMAAVVGGLLLWPGGDPDPRADPTPEPTSEPPAPTPPEDTGAVTGDLDGDGLGDFGTVGFEDGGLLYLSTGSEFRAKPVKRPDLSYPVVSGDVDGDGQLDVLSVGGSPPSVGVVVHRASGKTRSMLVQTPPSADFSEIYPMSGDLDGDGRDDVVIGSTSGTRLTLTAALSGDDGLLDVGRPWYAGTAAEGGFALGDFDGDGRDDLLQVDSSGDRVSVQMLRSTGSRFKRVGEEQSFPAIDYLFGVIRAGDFDGDGTDELVYLDSGPMATVWEWETDAFGAGRRWVDAQGFDSVTDVSVSDIDGDDLDDLVFLSDDKVQVLGSTGQSFEREKSWTFRLDREGVNGTIDPVEWRGY